MANRIVAGVERMEKQIAQRIANGIVTVERVEETRQALDMDAEEFVKFQELKTLAVAVEKLTLEEGTTIYNCLGETPEHFNKQSAAVKSVLTNLFSELLKMRLKQITKATAHIRN